MGTAYVKRSDGETFTLVEVATIGVAGDYVVFQYENGETGLEKNDGIESVQFTPDEAAQTVESSNGQVVNNETA